MPQTSTSCALQGWVVRKSVDANPGLKDNRRINSPSMLLKVFHFSYVLCSLGLLKLEAEGQTVLTEYLTGRLPNCNKNFHLSWVSLIGL